MKRTKDDVGCRIYTYGARIDKDDIGTCFDILREANRFYNAFIEIERYRFEANEALHASLSKRYIPFKEAAEQADEVYELAKKEARKKNSAKRKRAPSAEDEAELKKLKAEKKAAFAKLSKLGREIRKKPKYEKGYEKIKDKVSDLRSNVRTESSAAWGTRGEAETAAQAATSAVYQLAKKRHVPAKPPRFKAFDGSGKIAVQLQKKRAVSDVTDDAHPQLILPTEDGHGNVPWREGKIRIGSVTRLDPIWLNFQVKLHRPIPEDSEIRRAWLKATRVGVHTRWELQLVIARKKEVWEKDIQHRQAKKGVIAIDLGWRMRPDGDLRVAAFSGDDGYEGEITLPSDYIQRWLKTFELASIRKKRFNDAIAYLVEWRKKHLKKLPKWFLEDTCTAHQWRSQNRLARLVIKWRNNRFSGDRYIFQKMEGDEESWRVKDKHLLTWEAHQRRRCINWRKALYHDFAVDLAEDYGHVVIENIEWSKLYEQPDIFSRVTGTEEKILKKYRNMASVASLRNILIGAFRTSDIVEAADTTRRCHACGNICEWDHVILHHTCEYCGEKWDHDYNAARNIFHSI